MLHLGFFAVLARGLKKAIILLISVSLPAAASVLTLTGGVQGYLGGGTSQRNNIYHNNLFLHRQRWEERNQLLVTEWAARKDGCCRHW
jgi:hypothetical protein